MRTVSRIALVSITLFGCVACDQTSKAAARHYLAQGDSYSFLHDIFRLVHAENAGAFLSLGAALPEHTRMVMFAGLAGALTVAALLAALLARGLVDAGEFKKIEEQMECARTKAASDPSVILLNIPAPFRTGIAPQSLVAILNAEYAKHATAPRTVA